MAIAGTHCPLRGTIDYHRLTGNTLALIGSRFCPLFPLVISMDPLHLADIELIHMRIPVVLKVRESCSQNSGLIFTWQGVSTRVDKSTMACYPNFQHFDAVLQKC